VVAVKGGREGGGSSVAAWVNVAIHLKRYALTTDSGVTICVYRRPTALTIQQVIWLSKQSSRYHGPPWHKGVVLVSAVYGNLQLAMSLHQ